MIVRPSALAAFRLTANSNLVGNWTGRSPGLAPRRMRSTYRRRRPKNLLRRRHVIRPPRQTLNVYAGSDYAVTSHGGDYTVHVVVGVDPENRMYLLDLWRGQTSSDVWIEAWCDLVRKWRPALWAEEHGQIISGVGPFLQRRAIERQAYTRREQFVLSRQRHRLACSLR